MNSTIDNKYMKTCQCITNCDLECRCHKCHEEKGYFRTCFIVCAICGNKRCPKATNHKLECTNSNEPGQSGSIYIIRNINGETK